MTKLTVTHFSFTELCEVTGISSSTAIEIIEQGIVEPGGARPEDWRFNEQMMCLIQKAVRLHHDLEVEWSGIALALDLIAENERLREDNQRLQLRLQRFLAD